MQTGPNNLITDVAGLRVGNAQDDKIKTGTTVLVSDVPFTCGVSVMGGAPGTRETDLLAPDKTVQQVDALTLSGGSAFGLDASSGVADALRAQGRGFGVGDQTVPIVPGAILFDLLNGGDKDWPQNPYKDLGKRLRSFWTWNRRRRNRRNSGLAQRRLRLRLHCAAIRPHCRRSGCCKRPRGCITRRHTLLGRALGNR